MMVRTRHAYDQIHDRYRFENNNYRFQLTITTYMVQKEENFDHCYGSLHTFFCISLLKRSTR